MDRGIYVSSNHHLKFEHLIFRCHKHTTCFVSDSSPFLNIHQDPLHIKRSFIMNSEMPQAHNTYLFYADNVTQPHTRKEFISLMD